MIIQYSTGGRTQFCLSVISLAHVCLNFKFQYAVLAKSQTYNQLMVSYRNLSLRHGGVKFLKVATVLSFIDIFGRNVNNNWNNSEQHIQNSILQGNGVRKDVVVSRILRYVRTRS